MVTLFIAKHTTKRSSGPFLVSLRNWMSSKGNCRLLFRRRFFCYAMDHGGECDGNKGCDFRTSHEKGVIPG